MRNSLFCDSVTYTDGEAGAKRGAGEKRRRGRKGGGGGGNKCERERDLKKKKKKIKIPVTEHRSLGRVFNLEQTRLGANSLPAAERVAS